MPKCVLVGGWVSNLNQSTYQKEQLCEGAKLQWHMPICQTGIDASERCDIKELTWKRYPKKIKIFPLLQPDN